MTNNQIASMLMIILGIMIFILFVLICVFIYIRIKSKRQNKKIEVKVSDKSKIQQMYNVQSIFNFMEFDKIEDNMIFQKNGKRFLMIVECQGINYDLMSGIEKNSVEQGFLQYLNSLRYPIQIYIQTRTVNLSKSIDSYKEKVRTLSDNLSRREMEYNRKVRSGEYERNEMNPDRLEIARARNLYEYGLDIINSTEKMSLNKNILTKHYYVILSYYPEEASNGMYGKEEISNMAFSELYTRAQSTISLLSVCGINGKILNSNELADLLYTAYNREEAEVFDLQKAIDLGYDSLYTTSQDVFEKRIKELDRRMEAEAIEKANNAIQEVRQETEMEKKAREREEQRQDIVAKMASLILDNNEEVLGKEITRRAKEKVSGKSSRETKRKDKEDKVDEQEKVKKPGRPRKTA